MIKNISKILGIFIFLFLLHIYIQTLIPSNNLWASFLVPFTLGSIRNPQVAATLMTPIESPYTALKAAILYTYIIFELNRLYNRKKRTGMSILGDSFKLRR
jgi:hypothetical protein